MTTVSVFAPAKINLTLHITGRRSDGYHQLDSLVAFAGIGDSVTILASNELSLNVEGPEAAGLPTDMDNLALRAAALAADGRGATITLRKRLPIASGIGGTSADAAAAYRGMLALGAEGEAFAEGFLARPGLDSETLLRRLLGLGADVPMCFFSKPVRAGGVGEKLAFCNLPSAHAVLVNPRVPVLTEAVFGALDTPANSPMPDDIPNFPDVSALIEWLATCRNDLEASALSIAPEIGDVLETLSLQNGAELARMSGSGATCFGLFCQEADAREAEARLMSEHPDWWVAGTVLGDWSAQATPLHRWSVPPPP